MNFRYQTKAKTKANAQIYAKTRKKKITVQERVPV